MLRNKRTRFSWMHSITYRVPMLISDVYTYSNGETYAKCPRCLTPIDRDYQAYCDCCGQALNWDQWDEAIE